MAGRIGLFLIFSNNRRLRQSNTTGKMGMAGMCIGESSLGPDSTQRGEIDLRLTLFGCYPESRHASVERERRLRARS